MTLCIAFKQCLTKVNLVINVIYSYYETNTDKNFTLNITFYQKVWALLLEDQQNSV